MFILFLKTIIIIFIIIAILYLLAIMPKLRRNQDCKKLDGWLYAHRGLHNNKSKAPENSLKAFALAIKNGYGIELDVQLTKDFIPIIHHDYHLRRSCKIDYKISEHDYEEIKEFDLYKSKQKIPTLNEVLKLVDGKVPLIIELKIPWQAAKLCKIVSKILKDYKGIYCIQSFNPFGLMWYKKHQPGVVRGQLATDFNKEKVEGDKLQYFILKNMLMNFLAKPDFIAYHHVYKRGLSFTICRKLYRAKAIAWTIQSQEELEDCRNYYELFIFDSFTPELNKPE